MSEAKTYAGGCHCGNVRFEVDVELKEVVECNCSMCSKTGTRLAFVGADQFHLKSGADQLSDYQFNAKRIHHHFCPTCGIRSFARGKNPDGREMVAVNVRCLDGVDWSALRVISFDGKRL